MDFGRRTGDALYHSCSLSMMLFVGIGLLDAMPFDTDQAIFGSWYMESERVVRLDPSRCMIVKPVAREHRTRWSN